MMTAIGCAQTRIKKQICAAFIASLIAITLFSAQSVKASDTMSLVFVTSDHCPFCKAWERQVGYLYHKTPYGKASPLKRVDFTNIDTLLPGLSPKVRGTPTFIIIENDQEIGRIQGYTDADMFFWQLSDYVPLSD